MFNDVLGRLLSNMPRLIRGLLIGSDFGILGNVGRNFKIVAQSSEMKVMVDEIQGRLSPSFPLPLSLSISLSLSLSLSPSLDVCSVECL